MFQRLPRDNFPDDTESAAFQNYRNDKTSRQFHIPFNWRNWLVYGGLGALVLLLSFGIFVLYEQVGVSNNDGTNTPIPSATPIPIVMRGDFPPQVPQTFINIPARIDDDLPLGTSRGYTFHANPGVQWTFSVFTDGWTPQIDFYGEGGKLLTTASGSGNQTATITYFINQEDIYAIHLQSADGSSGGYTVDIMITELQ